MKFFGGRIVRLVVIGVIGLLAGCDANAACSVTSASSASFGTVTSFVVRNQAQSTSTPNSGLTCSGSLLGLFVIGDQINATITSANGGILKGADGSAIPYSIFADQGYSIQLNPGTTYNWASGQLLNLLGIFGGPATSLPLYFRTTTGSNVAAGTYADTLTINWNWSYCAGIGILGICLGRDSGSGSSSFQIQISVTNDCTITAPDVSFGSAPTVSMFSPISGSVSMACTKGLTYTVGMSLGNNANANGRRQMSSGSNLLQYDIFDSGSSVVWGQSINRVNSSGAADGVSTQQFPYVAKIYTDQATPPVGTYTDSVIVDVRY
ncbi:Csu type fimbrial protein [Burkholderia anthina]|uniref:Csu type fimbrial protein n=1 Tax=Burkholderia anthina TaxID=179879 RepID=UPI00158A3507|nr:spore coat U domain-containing protein [Burkholderia anthina]